MVATLQWLSCVRLFVTPWTPPHQASLFFTISQSLLKLMSIASVMPSNHLILNRPLLLPPSIFPSVRVFSNESVLCIIVRYWSFSFSISPSNEYSGIISFRIDWFDLLAVQGTLKESYSAAHLTLWDHNLDNHLKLDSSPPQMYYWAAMPQYMQAYNILVNLFKIIHSLSCFSRIQLFAMLWTKACQASLSMVFSRQKYWSGLPFPCEQFLSEVILLALLNPALG